MRIAAVKENIGAILIIALLLSGYGLWFWGQSGVIESSYYWGTVINSAKTPTGGGSRGYLAPFYSRMKVEDGKIISAGSLSLLKIDSVVCVQTLRNKNDRALYYNVVEAQLCRQINK
jgi:hypothetical protein